MINIDECLQEKVSCPDSLSCINFLNKSNVPSAVYTNTTSFVGVNAVIDPFCKCEFPQRVCYNGGTPDGDRWECFSINQSIIVMGRVDVECFYVYYFFKGFFFTRRGKLLDLLCGTRAWTARYPWAVLRV
jgi:hypothetical protein